VASTNDLKNGMVLDLDGQLWTVIWFQQPQAGQGQHGRAYEAQATS